MGQFNFVGGCSLDEITQLLQQTVPECANCLQPFSSVCLEWGCNNDALYCIRCSFEEHELHRSHDIRAIFQSNSFPDCQRELLSLAQKEKGFVKSSAVIKYVNQLIEDLMRVIRYKDKNQQRIGQYEGLYRALEAYASGRLSRQDIISRLRTGLKAFRLDYAPWPFSTINVDSIQLVSVRASEVNTCKRLVQSVSKLEKLKFDNSRKRFIKKLKQTCYTSGSYPEHVLGNQCRRFLQMTIQEAESYIREEGGSQTPPLRIRLTSLHPDIESQDIWTGFMRRFEGIREIYIDFQLAMPSAYPQSLQRLSIKVPDLKKVGSLNQLPSTLLDLRLSTRTCNVSEEIGDLISVLWELPLLHSFVLNSGTVGRQQQKWLARYAIDQYLRMFQLCLNIKSTNLEKVSRIMLKRSLLMAQAAVIGRSKTLKQMCWNQQINLLEVVGWEVDDLI